MHPISAGMLIWMVTYKNFPVIEIYPKKQGWWRDMWVTYSEGLEKASALYSTSKFSVSLLLSQNCSKILDKSHYIHINIYIDASCYFLLYFVDVVKNTQYICMCVCVCVCIIHHINKIQKQSTHLFQGAEKVFDKILHEFIT